jgi:protoporphyrin/coproporphyrin ferrochelatase
VERAILLVTHGTVDDLADLPAFVTNIRRGHAPPPELIAELVHRYNAIGGRSPLNDTTRALADKLATRLGVPVRMASRLWKPFIKDVLGELDAREVVALPMAQHSSAVYVRATEDAAKELTPTPRVVGIADWGQTPALLDAFAARIRKTALSLDANARANAVLVLSAHSLPMAIIARGDAYEREVRASAEAVAARVRDVLPNHLVAFQSQGMSQGGGAWLGPDLTATLDTIKNSGKKTAIFAPIGFLADHVEILYDLDIEARAWAEQRGLVYVRAPSLNADDDFVDVLVKVLS